MEVSLQKKGVSPNTSNMPKNRKNTFSNYGYCVMIQRVIHIIDWNTGRYIYFYYESIPSTLQALTLITNNGHNSGYR